MTLLPPEAFDLGYRHALDAKASQGFFYFLEFEGFNDGYDEFHARCFRLVPGD
jgi:hypothetical protein